MGGNAAFPGSRLVVIRRAELAVLRAQLAEAGHGQPRFVLLDGELGMGRTTLLDQFAAEAGAEGAKVLRASGEEYETPLRYGVVQQLCRAVQLPLPPALSALGDPTEPLPEPFVAGAALLDVLRSLQARAPVVVVVDDAHLSDAVSQLALLFALRRLHAERVMVVMSVQVDAAALLVRGLRKLIAGDAGTRLHLSGLADAQIRELGSALCSQPLSRALVERLREHTGGNPLHLRTLLEEFGVAALDRAGHVPLPAPRSFSVVVHGWLAACTAEARLLVGATAVVGMQCEFGFLRRVSAVSEPLSALQVAVDARLVEFRERQVFFPHPLVRAAVYHALGIRERAELHGRVAGLLDDEAATLRHRTAAATEQDQALASALAAFAGTEAARGAWAGAAASFMDAARLAPGGAAREGHVLDAVECLLVGGDVAAAAALASELETYGDAARAHYLLGRLAHLGGRPDDAARLLARAEELGPPSPEPVLAANVATELAGVYLCLLRPADALARAERAARTLEGTPLAHRPLPYLALGLALTGRSGEALEDPSRFPEPPGGSGPDGADILLARSILRLCSGSLGQAGDIAPRLDAATARLGQPLVRVSALAVMAVTEYRLGAWEDAVAHAELGVSIAEGANLFFPRSTLHAAAVWPLAGFGRWDAAQAHADGAGAVARGPWETAMAALARGALAHARGRHQEVLDAVAVLRSFGTAGAVDEPDGFWPWQELYVDASIAVERLDDAARELEHFEALAAARHSVSGTVTASRLRGSLELARGNPQEARHAFRRSVSLCSKLPLPFDQAVTRAAYGSFLRRIGSRSAAVTELRAGRDGFERLGALAWVQTCDRELAACGLTPRKRRENEQTALTPQEASVARLVAEGKSNRAVASELVVSVNTVEYHLKNIFAKLGITSRSQLVLRLVAGPAGTPPGHS
jgi:DNA-binding CsgD family transcriptional regulator